MNINATFKATFQKSPAKGGWTYVIWPESAQFFGTKGLVKVTGLIDGKAFRASFMAMGGGIHKLGIDAKTRELIHKEAGDEVTIQLMERLN